MGKENLLGKWKKYSMEDLKRILIVDDSEIDREILRSILDDEFEVVETDNGFSALDVIFKKNEHFDAVLLDVSMPLMDGLSVLRILRENNLDDVQIFMITVEATKENIEMASQYDISEFIKKPFERDEVLKRVRAKLGVAEQIGYNRSDIDETRKYITNLEFLYDQYLNLSGNEKGRDERRAQFMKIFLEKCPDVKQGMEYDDFQIEMISKAAYFCNIGNMLLPNMPSVGKIKDNKAQSNIYQQHTVMGADIVRLNYSRHCRKFVQICADICLHHHERIDGKGFPYGISGNSISIYAQICGLLEKFEELFFQYSRQNAMQFDYVINQLKTDQGLVSDKVFFMLVDSKPDIIEYYNSINV